jgi:hypothetical protein
MYEKYANSVLIANIADFARGKGGSKRLTAEARSWDSRGPWLSVLIRVNPWFLMPYSAASASPRETRSIARGVVLLGDFLPELGGHVLREHQRAVGAGVNGLAHALDLAALIDANRAAR